MDLTSMIFDASFRGVFLQTWKSPPRSRRRGRVGNIRAQTNNAEDNTQIIGKQSECCSKWICHKDVLLMTAKAKWRSRNARMEKKRNKMPHIQERFQWLTTLAQGASVF
eukprot:Gb_12876 [translate_table: standard]